MRRVRGLRLAVLVGALGFAASVLTACDSTPPMIGGTVTLDGTATPAAGLKVTAFAAATETEVASVTVGADGRFVFRKSTLADGSYRLRFGANTWWEGATDWAGATPVTASEAAPPELALSVAASTISGYVGDYGSPFAGVTVQALVPGSGAIAATTSTDAAGNYALTVPDGAFIVRFSAPGRATLHYGPGSGTPWFASGWPVTVGPGGTISGIAANLGAQGAPISGRILDGAVPLSGAVVVALHPTFPDVVAQAVTGSDGRFTIANLWPAEYRLRINRPGVASVNLPGTYQASSYNIGTVRMPAPGCGAPVLAPGSDLTGCDLRGRDLTGVDLTGATLTGVRSGANTGVPAALPAGWRLSSGYLVGQQAYLARAALNTSDLAGADLTGAELISANLRGADLSAATLAGASLPLSDLRDADLTGADLGQADVQGAQFRGTVLTGADLNGIDLGSSSLAGVRSGAVVGVPAALPVDWALFGGYLVGPEADLSGANLAGVDLSGTNLFGAIFTGADLAGTNLSGADLRRVRSGTVTGTPAALPVDWSLRYGYLMGSNAVLTGADLSDADLTGVSLYAADLTGASLARAGLGGTNLYSSILTGVDLTDADFTPPGSVSIGLSGVTSGGIIGTPLNLPQGWQLRGGYLFGTNANLTGVDLTGLDLSGVEVPSGQFINANLTDVDLTGAYLVSARFSNVNLSGADLSGADLTGIISSGITGIPLALPVGWSISSGTLVYAG